MTLTGKTIIVGGGTGDVGVDIVGALASEGARVLVPTRSLENGEMLRDRIGDDAFSRVTLIEAGFASDEDADRLQGVLEDHGQLDGAVASLGSWFTFGPIAEMRADQWQLAFDSLLTSHALFARAVLPRMETSGSYVFINGAGSETPVPNSAAVSVMARGLSMLIEAVTAEHQDLRVHTLMLRSIIATRARKTAQPEWVTSKEVGEAVAFLFSPLGQLTAGATTVLNAKK